MASFKILSFFYLCASAVFLVCASPAPQPAAITAAPVIPRSPAQIQSELEYRNLLHYQARANAIRQLKPGMNVCFGNGAICSLSLTLSCNVGSAGDEWYKCQCESGRVATNAACQLCQDFYGLGGTFSIEDWKENCSEKGFEIKPVPSSIMASWSRFNQTMTANTARSTGAGGSGASTTSSRSAATLSVSSLDLPTVSFINTRSTLTGTLTFLGDPTGVIPTPLTTTTGVAPLQNAPAGSGASIGRAGELFGLLLWGLATFMVMAGTVLVL